MKKPFNNPETDPVEWRKKEKRIRRKSIEILVLFVILIIILIWHRDQVFIVIQNIGVIIGLINDIRVLVFE